MVSTELLEILRCPNCVREKDGTLKLYKDSWLVCQDCGRKYPIDDDIPVMLIDEGDLSNIESTINNFISNPLH